MALDQVLAEKTGGFSHSLGDLPVLEGAVGRRDHQLAAFPVTTGSGEGGEREREGQEGEGEKQQGKEAGWGQLDSVLLSWAQLPVH